MSAVGRLWRRAPAWRLTVAAAIALTALAAMFPPTLPRWLPAHLPRGAGMPPGSAPDLPAPGGEEPAAHFVPQPAPPPADYGVVAFPPPGPGRAGIIPFAGRKLPLPIGTWQELVLARSGGVGAEQAVALARIEAGRLTGLLLAASPGPVGRDAAPMAGLAACFVPDAIAHQLIPATAADGPLARECWTLTAFDTAEAASGPRPDEVMRGGLDRLARMAVAVPKHMLALRYVRTDDTGWLTVLLLLPDRRGDVRQADRRLQTWIRRYVTVLHKGFDGTLPAADLTAAVARDPD